ncbi:MAG: sulfatase family protein [Promethearchaeota archaeon]
MKVILIVADTLRYKNLGFNGYIPKYSRNNNSPSPNIDKLAYEGVVFDNYFTHINCTHPSFTTMLSGRYPISHTIISHASLHEINNNVIMIPEILRDNGVKTAAIDNMYRWFVKGFEDYIHSIREGAIRNTFVVPANLITDKAINWLKSHAKNNQPFFLMLHYWDPHVPYAPPKEYQSLYYHDDPKNPSTPNYPKMENIPPEKLDWIFKGFMSGWQKIKDLNYFKAQYDSEIKFMDDQIGRLIDYLRKSDILDDILIIFTADHGESMDEHEIYFTHVHLYDQMMHIPLIFRYPKKFPQNIRKKALIGNVDLAATILNLYGIEIPNYIEGKSFLPILEGKTDTHRSKIYMFEHEAISRRGIRTLKWKFIKNARKKNEMDINSRLEALGYISIMIEPLIEKELYDLENDPEELKNLINEYPQIAKELEEDLENFVEEICKRVGINDPQQEQELEPWGEITDVKDWLYILNERNKKFKEYKK